MNVKSPMRVQYFTIPIRYFVPKSGGLANRKSVVIKQGWLVLDIVELQ